MKTSHSLVLRGKLRMAVRWIMERGIGGVLQPEEICTKTEERVMEVLRAVEGNYLFSITTKLW